MKGSRNLAEMKQEREEMQGWVRWLPCASCGREISGAYGRHFDGKTERWTCGRKCELVFKAQQEAENASNGL